MNLQVFRVVFTISLLHWCLLVVRDSRSKNTHIFVHTILMLRLILDIYFSLEAQQYSLERIIHHVHI